MFLYDTVSTLKPTVGMVLTLCFSLSLYKIAASEEWRTSLARIIQSKHQYPQLAAAKQLAAQAREQRAHRRRQRARRVAPQHLSRESRHDGPSAGDAPCALRGREAGRGRGAVCRPDVFCAGTMGRRPAGRTQRKERRERAGKALLSYPGPIRRVCTPVAARDGARRGTGECAAHTAADGTRGGCARGARTYRCGGAHRNQRAVGKPNRGAQCADWGTAQAGRRVAECTAACTAHRAGKRRAAGRDADADGTAYRRDAVAAADARAARARHATHGARRGRGASACNRHAGIGGSRRRDAGIDGGQGCAFEWYAVRSGSVGDAVGGSVGPCGARAPQSYARCTPPLSGAHRYQPPARRARCAADPA